MEKKSKFNKRRAFNKAVGPGKKSKINKRRATFIPDYRVGNNAGVLCSVHLYSSPCTIRV